MALVSSANNSPPCPCYFQKTVTLHDWWLTSPETTDDTTTLAVAGLTSQQSRGAARCFSSAPILKIYDLFELETVDGVSVILQGFINKDRTLQNGFHPQVFDHFIIGFPPNWKEFSTKRPKIESGEGSDSIKGSYTVDMGVEIPHEEHIVEAGNEVLSPGFEDDQSLNKSPITGSKSLGSRRMTRSMIKAAQNLYLEKGINQNVDISNQGRISDLEEKHIVSECLSNPPSADDMGTNVKGFRKKKKTRVEKKLPVKRKLITTPKSTSSRGKKGSEERHGSPNILSLESFSGKKSRSGRVVLPPLQFWRNQTLVYDEDRQVCGVQEPK